MLLGLRAMSNHDKEWAVCAVHSNRDSKQQPDTEDPEQEDLLHRYSRHILL
jgi:hypothetical protein